MGAACASIPPTTPARCLTMALPLLQPITILVSRHLDLCMYVSIPRQQPVRQPVSQSSMRASSSCAFLCRRDRTKTKRTHHTHSHIPFYPCPACLSACLPALIFYGSSLSTPCLSTYPSYTSLPIVTTQSNDWRCATTHGRALGPARERQKSRPCRIFTA